MSKLLTYIKHLVFYIVGLLLSLASCKTHQLPAFSDQQWHVDSFSGNAVSTEGLELAFGSEWMITDTTLIQTDAQLLRYPELSSYLAKGMEHFPEIAVDSLLFYNQSRRLLFFTYHQVKPLKPLSEIYLYNESGGVYSTEYARIFGEQYIYIDDSGWEAGPTNSVYVNASYHPKDKQLVLLQRIPYNNLNIAVLEICSTIPRGDKWLYQYPRYTFFETDLGKNIVKIASIIEDSKNRAVENLKLALKNRK